MSKQLLVGPFPLGVAFEDRKEILCYFGALNVNKAQRKKNYVIAIFDSQKDCEYALRKIHQIELFGNRISAHYYDSSGNCHLPGRPVQNDSEKEEPAAEFSKIKMSLLEYEAQLSSINYRFDIRNPISPKLRYAYPPPSPTVLCNISHTLVSVPRFYAQVLHLMNKMNLPCPFGPLTKEPPLCEEARKLTQILKPEIETPKEIDSENILTTNDLQPVQDEETEESESELESDEEVKLTLLKSKQEPKLKRILRKSNKINKKPRLETLKQSLLAPRERNKIPGETALIQEVFEMPSINPVKKLSVNVPTTTSISFESTSAGVVVEGFGKLYPSTKDNSTAEKKTNTQFISLEELSKNRILKSDWPIVPVFKNYNPGTPSSRLYIKNLAKTVTETDLRFIFGRFLRNLSEMDKEKFSVRLMKEGRMKGQAFVTFDCLETASEALKEVNGYILKDKPVVIFFGKTKSND